ncbi:MAG: peptidylprolyl isomerase [Actinomycetota bacterium]
MPAAEKRRRKKELSRQRREEALKRYRARRRRRSAITLGVVGAITAALFVLIAQARREPQQEQQQVEGCTDEEPQREEVGPFEEPPMTLDESKEYFATIETSCGTIEARLVAQVSPKTVNSFAFLAGEGFYDGLTFHRIARDSVVQGGDPNGDGSGDPGYSITEPPPPGAEYPLGALAMARGPNDPPGASGSQFFIVSGPQGAQLNGNAEFPAQYAVLGIVTEGFETLERLNSVETFTPPDSNEKATPRTPVYILKITVSERSPTPSPSPSPG